MKDTPAQVGLEAGRVPGEAATAQEATLHTEESGQVMIIVVFGALAFILLIALIYNTATQTSRKIEMQGAADSAAVSAGVWTARGMNLMVVNNNTMVQVLSIMITVRAIVQTCQIMISIDEEIAAVAAATVVLSPVATVLNADVIWYKVVLTTFSYIDGALSSIGWTVLTALDRFNQVIKEFFPALPTYNATRYAELNGADQYTPYNPLNGILLPRKATALIFPIFPVARGPRNLLLDKALECPLANPDGKLRNFARHVVAPICLFDVLCAPLTGFFARDLVDKRIDKNIDALRGGPGSLLDNILDRLPSAYDIVESLARRLGIPTSGLEGLPFKIAAAPLHTIRFPVFYMTPSLQWQADPRPMVLTTTPENDTTEKTDTSERENRDVFKYLQFLAVAVGKLKEQSPMAGGRYKNLSMYPRITYAQADVYNPTKWDMFTQDWRAKLVRATLIDEKCRDLAGMIGLPACERERGGWSFVNTH
jgi:hypothetical protein